MITSNQYAETAPEEQSHNDERDELEKLQEKMHKIKTWIDAYPLNVFPEPDFQKAHQVLKQHGMTLDAISASNMRHVLEGIKNIIETDNHKEHGKTCKKVVHIGTGYLHSKDDDAPYNVDGCFYCGRCHEAL